jgi:drug/metabolite transporter (DMT)-like permease
VLGAVLSLVLMTSLGLASPRVAAALPFHASASPGAIASIAFMVLVPGVLCFSLWYWIAERAPVSLLSLSTLIPPPIAGLLGWAFLQEQIGVETLVGSALIFTALLLTWQEKTDPVPEEP